MKTIQYTYKVRAYDRHGDFITTIDMPDNAESIMEQLFAQYYADELNIRYHTSNSVGQHMFEVFSYDSGDYLGTLVSDKYQG